MAGIPRLYEIRHAMRGLSHARKTLIRQIEALGELQEDLKAAMGNPLRKVDAIEIEKKVRRKALDIGRTEAKISTAEDIVFADEWAPPNRRKEQEDGTGTRRSS